MPLTGAVSTASIACVVNATSTFSKVTVTRGAAAAWAFAQTKAYLSSREALQMSESDLERELHRRGQELMRKLLQGHRTQTNWSTSYRDPHHSSRRSCALCAGVGAPFVTSTSGVSADAVSGYAPTRDFRNFARRLGCGVPVSRV